MGGRQAHERPQRGGGRLAHAPAAHRHRHQHRQQGQRHRGEPGHGRQRRADGAGAQREGGDVAADDGETAGALPQPGAPCEPGADDIAAQPVQRGLQAARSAPREQGHRRRAGCQGRGDGHRGPQRHARRRAARRQRPRRQADRDHRQQRDLPGQALQHDRPHRRPHPSRARAPAAPRAHRIAADAAGHALVEQGGQVVLGDRRAPRHRLAEAPRGEAPALRRQHDLGLHRQERRQQPARIRPGERGPGAPGIGEGQCEHEQAGRQDQAPGAQGRRARRRCVGRHGRHPAATARARV